jgi:hypothetical protein
MPEANALRYDVSGSTSSGGGGGAGGGGRLASKNSFIRAVSCSVGVSPAMFAEYVIPVTGSLTNVTGMSPPGHSSVACILARDGLEIPLYMFARDFASFN